MSILEKASEAVSGDRMRYYGHPKDNHRRTAILWNAYFDARVVGTACDGVFASHEVGAVDVCYLNILQKISRDMATPHEDTLVDIAGYARNIELVRE